MALDRGPRGRCRDVSARGARIPGRHRRTRRHRDHVRIYSIIFGSGLIVGPVLGGALTQALGPIAFAVIALGLIGISGTGVLFIREPLKTPRTAVAPESPIPPETR